MSQALSNLSFSLFLEQTRTSGILQLFTPNNRRFSCNKCHVKIMAAGESRENLDHYQRAGKRQQPQPKKPVAPVAPTARTVQQLMEDPFTYSGTSPSPLPSLTGGYNIVRRTPWEIKEGEEYIKVLVDKAEKVPKDK